MSYHIILPHSSGIMNKDVILSIPGRLGVTREEKEALYRFLRDEIRDLQLKTPLGYLVRFLNLAKASIHSCILFML
ncbi:hypothetical protein MNV_1800009 [Candidatus Methanoperedens nitroreducens]|uniref:Uncharacterized protein n=1 Tax=Candidatus Methanoperedens nitratireducens TaxID=1392998 RepID=A0A284VMC5_9EURY|nr:hypothetical protein MNV_1800009 [Candidatus Methanoperedens nitroreducens]